MHVEVKSKEKVYIYIEWDQTITHVCMVSGSDSDLLVCGGEFPGLLIFENGILCHEISDMERVTSLSARKDELLVGTTDAVLLFKFSYKPTIVSSAR